MIKPICKCLHCNKPKYKPYLVVTSGHSYILQARDYSEVIKHKKKLSSLGYKNIFVYKRDKSLEKYPNFKVDKYERRK